MIATANAATWKELQMKLCMKDCLEAIENPDRDNIKFKYFYSVLNTTFH